MSEPRDGQGGRKPVNGVFSTMEVRTIGTGTTTRRSREKQYWLARESGAGMVEIQPINDKLIPVGPKRIVRIEDLLERFEPEPEFYVRQDEQPRAPVPLPEIQAPAPKEKELFEYPEDVEKSARASFGLGILYLKRGNLMKAKEIFDRLADAEANYRPRHKHMWNEFGISLRKERLPDAAVRHYQRAIALDDKDDHLLMNIARAYYEQNDIPRAVRFLERSLELNPDLEYSRRFLDYIRRTRALAGDVKTGF
jgi:tetratricopeptide (TPR) repeat protein